MKCAMNPPPCVKAERKSPVIYLAVAMETGNASCCVVSQVNCVSTHRHLNTTCILHNVQK
jgi:hypothetical protein